MYDKYRNDTSESFKGRSHCLKIVRARFVVQVGFDDICIVIQDLSAAILAKIVKV